MSSWVTPYLVWFHCLKRTPSFLNRVTRHVLFDMGFSRPIWKQIILPCRPTPGVFERHCAAHAATSLTYNGFPLLPQAANRKKSSGGCGKNTISNWEHSELRFTLSWNHLDTLAKVETSRVHDKHACFFQSGLWLTFERRNSHSLPGPVEITSSYFQHFADTSTQSLREGDNHIEPCSRSLQYVIPWSSS